MTLDVGPNASIGSIVAMLTDMQRVIDFAQEVQTILARNEAAYSIIRRRDFGDFIDDPEFGRRFFPSEAFLAMVDGGPLLRSPGFQRAVDAALQERGPLIQIVVTRLSYENPLGLNINFDGSAIARILEVIRDWGPARRQAGANADRAEAEVREARARADRYEEKARFEKQIQETLLRVLTTEELRLGRDQVGAVLSQEVVKSIATLADAGLGLEVLPDEEEAPDFGES